MPVRRHNCPRICALALSGLVAATATPVWAQDNGGDPQVVLTRTVHPRIAYRGVPVEEMPVDAAAPTFPAQVFHGALGTTLEPLAGDELVRQHGANGVLGGIGARLTRPGVLPDPASMFGANPQGGAGRVPVGPGASIAGAVSGATAGLGDRISSTVLQAVAPVTSQQGGGP
jgi:hypothetical protein